MRSAVTAVAIATGLSSFAEAQGDSVFADASWSSLKRGTIGFASPALST